MGAPWRRGRKRDPGIATAAVRSALDDASPALNETAGSGSGERCGRPEVAGEPAAVMVTKRAVGAAPAVRAAGEAVPSGDGTAGDHVPGDDASGDGMPGDGTSGDHVPGDGMPGDHVPSDGTSGDHVPGDHVPGDGASGDDMPGDDVPGGVMGVLTLRRHFPAAARVLRHQPTVPE